MMVLLGYIPFLHACAVVAAAALPLLGKLPMVCIWASPALLYLLPPIVSRLGGLWLKMPDGIFEPHSREFLYWWFHAQWQVIFNRFPALEEALRLVPSLYSFWLRIWGSRIGSFVYWSSGVIVLDRGCLRIGDRVVFGVGAVMSPHNLAPDGSQRLKLLISPVHVEQDSMIGGQAILAPGVRIGAGELLPAFQRMMPFSEWRGGRRTRRGAPDWITAAALVTSNPDSSSTVSPDTVSPDAGNSGTGSSSSGKDLP